MRLVSGAGRDPPVESGDVDVRGAQLGAQPSEGVAEIEPSGAPDGRGQSRHPSFDGVNWEAAATSAVPGSGIAAHGTVVAQHEDLARRHRERSESLFVEGIAERQVGTVGEDLYHQAAAKQPRRVPV